MERTFKFLFMALKQGKNKQGTIERVEIYSQHESDVQEFVVQFDIITFFVFRLRDVESRKHRHHH